ncbi:30S ribosomal protein S17 [Candidatus Hydrogenisulfobacillus filiaventi]|uniref:Small ribosomal subunit protein uS17 n=1 Tax=Candidatus Hydrogenisulfobacillus filiaventi TaxID=2707344 RepID=A0A6F8ZJ84_9FIRM|nr:30S ribosomal protein S17 [Bacillota bacterium]CAB1129939.1 30S ribosomal protein S17 [Candidatus Hydrogenisulfobacillus filiaventi]
MAEEAAGGRQAPKSYGNRKVRVGRVVSDKMDKTVVVAVESLVAHPLYGKRIRRTKKFKAHDEENRCRVGDKVRIVETRPLSKEKRWRVVEILERAEEL